MPMAPKTLSQRKVERYGRVKDNRPSASRRGYDKTWQAFRRMMISRRPICQDCKRDPSTTVHHIVKLRDGGKNSPKNVLCLCKRDHDVRTGKGE